MAHTVLACVQMGIHSIFDWATFLTHLVNQLDVVTTSYNVRPYHCDIEQPSRDTQQGPRLMFLPPSKYCHFLVVRSASLCYSSTSLQRKTSYPENASVSCRRHSVDSESRGSYARTLMCTSKNSRLRIMSTCRDINIKVCNWSAQNICGFIYFSEQQ